MLSSSQKAQKAAALCSERRSLMCPTITLRLKTAQEPCYVGLWSLRGSIIDYASQRLMAHGPCWYIAQLSMARAVLKAAPVVCTKFQRHGACCQIQGRRGHNMRILSCVESVLSWTSKACHRSLSIYGALPGIEKYLSSSVGCVRPLLKHFGLRFAAKSASSHTVCTPQKLDLVTPLSLM